MSENNTDLAILITDDILNTFEIDGACNIKKDQVDKLFCIVHRSIQNKKDSKVLTSEIYNHFNLISINTEKISFKLIYLTCIL